MKRLFVPILLVMGILGGAAWYLLWPVSMAIPLTTVESTLGQLLSQKPLNWNQVIKLELLEPKLSAAEESRLRMNLKGNLQPALLRSYQGELVLVTGLIYKPETGEFFLGKLQVEQVRFEDVPALYTDPLKQMANQLLPPIVAQVPVYKLNPDQLPERALKKMLMAVSIQEDKIKIVFQNRYLHLLLSQT